MTNPELPAFNEWADLGIKHVRRRTVPESETVTFEGSIDGENWFPLRTFTKEIIKDR